MSQLALAATLFVSLSFALPARAQSLFAVDTTAGISGMDSNISRLFKDLVRRTGSFATLSGESSYNASLTYAGLEGAMAVRVSDGGRTVTVAIPSANASRTFTGEPDDVANQITAWVRSVGADLMSELVSASNSGSPLGILDGNPRATTAVFASSAFGRWALGASRWWKRDDAEDGFELRVDGSTGSVRVPGYGDLSASSASLTFGGHIDSTVGLAVSAMGQLREYAGTSIYDLGAELALPLTLASPEGGSGLRWLLTPFAQLAAAASGDALAGGGLFGAGLANELSVDVGPVTFAVASQLAGYTGVPLGHVGELRLDTPLVQLLVQTGLAIQWEAAPWIELDAGVHHTWFAMGDAAVPQYWTPNAGVTFVLEDVGGLRVGYRGDLAADYHADRVDVRLDVHFR